MIHIYDDHAARARIHTYARMQSHLHGLVYTDLEAKKSKVQNIEAQRPRKKYKCT